MPNVTATLKKALNQLRADRARIERQIAAVEGALASLGASAGRRTRTVKKPAANRAGRKMSATQKRAVSNRMKAYWAKRRKEAKK